MNQVPRNIPAVAGPGHHAGQHRPIGGETQLYVWGDARLGKSHLLQAACHQAGLQNLTATYLQAAQLQKLSPEVFEGLESLQLVCIDDVHQLLEDRCWEMPLFDLVNRVREAGSHLVVSSNCSPAALSLALPDLESRLRWGPVLQILPLDDHRKVDAIQQRAESRGLELSIQVAQYMLHHLPRDLATLLEMKVRRLCSFPVHLLPNTNEKVHLIL